MSVGNEQLDLEELVARASAGDRAALEAIVKQIQKPVYNLALRMLWRPADAEDASQEILIRVITRLNSYRGESAFTTWVYRVAANYLLTTRRRRAEQARLTFEAFGADLDEGLSDGSVDVAAEVEEVRIGCTQGMLLCLERPQRLAYILGEILEMNGVEAAAILEIEPAAFRKRLSRARAAVRAFMQRKCGIVNPDNHCRCARRVNRAVEVGRVEPANLLFAGHARGESQQQIEQAIRSLDRLQRAAALYRSHPDYSAPASLTAALRELVGATDEGLPG